MGQPRSGVDGPETTGGAEAFLPVQAFLSLYLVLLAFFIVLASVSQPEAGRAVKAIASALLPQVRKIGVSRPLTTLPATPPQAMLDRTTRVTTATSR